MRIFKNLWFTRFAQKEAISDDELKGIVNLLDAGQADADLGGGVYKVRLARPGEGKSGGYRVIVFFRSRDRMFFVYGFAKSKMENISQRETRDYKKMAIRYFRFTQKEIEFAVKTGKLVEIGGVKNEKEIPE